ncbi:MAG: TetR family transcriptional regulator [Acidaminococcaceae bacterium]|nr:TetR family transcriptional regulator [Acidaminococcaceae bacterium]MBO6039439.1 TetR family transcriptional regulator [Acidaminococcaceae bacterium]MBP5736182.1 TetR family transcriptional regulator [Acidaminococcaceae bacterium]
MDFIRARGEEQKKIRVQQIVDTAAALYAETGYDKVALSKIARKLNFTRLNVYNYFHCKEDIFLELLLQDIWKMVEDAEITFTEEVKDTDSFCLSWAALMLRHPRLIALFSIVNTVILKGATSEMHRRFRIEMEEAYNRLIKLTETVFPKISHAQAARFVEYENSYAMTLYPASIEYKKSQHIEIFKDAGFGTRDFVSQYVAFLKMLLNGLKIN